MSKLEFEIYPTEMKYESKIYPTETKYIGYISDFNSIQFYL
jgi:hypothetical protein